MKIKSGGYVSLKSEGSEYEILAIILDINRLQ